MRFYLFSIMYLNHLIQSFLLMWCNLPLAKFQGSRGVFYILFLMDNCQTIWSHVFVLSIRWTVNLSVFCFVRDLMVAAVAWFQNNWGVPHCPNYWMNGCETELKDSLGMAILIENKIMFVLVWIIIVLMMLHQMCSCVFAHCIDGRLYFGRGVLV